MTGVVPWVVEVIQTHPGWWGLAVVFGGAFLEYVLPPLPADTIVLAGALLVLAGVQSVWSVGCAAVAGGFAGCAAGYGIGRTLARPDGTFRGERWMERIFGSGSIHRFVVRFRKYGYRLILVNRAFPAVRGITFVAAGAMQLDFVRTMVAGLVSHVAWVGMILGVGVSVGGRWEKIQQVFAVYESAMYAIATGVVLIAGLVWWMRSKRGGSA